jgi:uncharacterized protein (UPF0218 family)
MEYRLPPTLRKTFSRPLGQLFQGPPTKSIPSLIQWLEFNDLLQPLRIIAIGDIVSHAVITHPRLISTVKYCLVDGGTQREGELKHNFPKQFRNIFMKNAPGTISGEFFEFFRTTWHDTTQYFITVKGEEDLLVIPAVIECSNAVVLYGQPPITDAGNVYPAGCVAIHVTQLVQKDFHGYLAQFDQKEE